MLWDASANAGFSTAPTEKLYIPQDPDPARRTVEKQEADRNSLLNYVRGLIQLRAAHPALGNDGDWTLVSGLGQPYPMVYERVRGGETCRIVINPTAKTVSASLPAHGGAAPEIIGGFYKNATVKSSGGLDKFTVSPVSAVIYKY